MPCNTLGAPGGLACLMAAFTGSMIRLNGCRGRLQGRERFEPVDAWADRYRELYRSSSSSMALWNTISNPFPHLLQSPDEKPD